MGLGVRARDRDSAEIPRDRPRATVGTPTTAIAMPTQARSHRGRLSINETSKHDQGSCARGSSQTRCYPARLLLHRSVARGTVVRAKGSTPSLDTRLVRSQVMSMREWVTGMGGMSREGMGRGMTREATRPHTAPKSREEAGTDRTYNREGEASTRASVEGRDRSLGRIDQRGMPSRRDNSIWIKRDIRKKCRDVDRSSDKIHIYRQGKAKDKATRHREAETSSEGLHRDSRSARISGARGPTR